MHNLKDIKNNADCLGVIDGEFIVYMHRTADPYKGELALYNSDGQELFRVEKTIGYGSAFGYDSEDMNAWFDFAAEWIDRTLYQIGGE